jgi:hypothetical protein
MTKKSHEGYGYQQTDCHARPLLAMTLPLSFRVQRRNLINVNQLL